MISPVFLADFESKMGMSMTAAPTGKQLLVKRAGLTFHMQVCSFCSHFAMLSINVFLLLENLSSVLELFWNLANSFLAYKFCWKFLWNFIVKFMDVSESTQDRQVRGRTSL